MNDSMLTGVVLGTLAAIGALSLFTGYIVPRLRASLGTLFDFSEWLLNRSRKTREIWRGTWERRG